MYKILILAFLFVGNPIYPPVKRDARISKTDMEKSLVFVRKDAAHCRGELKGFKQKLEELNTDVNKYKKHVK